MKQLLACCVLAFLFSYCQPKKNTSETGEATQVSVLPDMHNAQNALDWAGIYKGTLPCADCEGIATTITLHDDLTFNLFRKYLQSEEETFAEDGTFSWNEEGNTIKLSTDGRQYFAGENILFHLDNEGRRITGELAERYTLQKANADKHAVTDTYWKLVTIGDEPIAALDGNKEAHFILVSEENSIRGFAGCNGFGGSYSIQDDNQITFFQLFSTKMACPNLDTEHKFMKALEATQGFKIDKDELWLIDSNQNPVAKFESSNQ